jgi:hypothetical protein
MCNCNARSRERIFRRIKAAHCPIEVDVPPDDSRRELTIVQTGEATLFDMGARGTALSLWVRFAREKPGQLAIAEFADMCLPSGPLSVIWLDPLPQSGCPSYRLPNGFEFPRDVVLNDRLGGNGLCVRSGRFVEGFVLGSTETRIPAKCSTRYPLDAQFSVLDGTGRDFCGEVQLVVDRSTATATRPRPARSGGGLYALNERPLPVERVPNRIQPRRMGSLYEPAKYPANGTVLPTIDRHLEKHHTARLQKDENPTVQEGTELD